jgi:hypothetical protein
MCFGIKEAMYPIVIFNTLFISILTISLTSKQNEKKFYNKFVLYQKNLFYIRGNGQMYKIHDNTEIDKYDKMGRCEIDEMTLIPFFFKQKYNLDKIELLIQFSTPDQDYINE